MPNFEMPKNNAETSPESIFESLSEEIKDVEEILEKSHAAHKQYALDAFRVAVERIKDDKTTTPESIEHLARWTYVEMLMVESLSEVTDDPKIVEAVADEFQLVFRNISGDMWNNAVEETRAKAEAKKPVKKGLGGWFSGKK